MKQIFLATTNQGKIERFKNLLSATGMDIQVCTAKDLGIDAIDIQETGTTIAENAEMKARAYLGKVSMPILANDTGFYVKGDGFVDAPKRKALGETDERTLTKEEIGERLLAFWKNVATRHGGSVDAAWIEAFVVVNPDGTVRKAESRREVILTDKEFGKAHIQMPVRGLYISKITNKPAILHSEQEEILEMKPVINALREVLQS